jgi:hypothetical protein
MQVIERGLRNFDTERLDLRRHVVPPSSLCGRHFPAGGPAREDRMVATVPGANSDRGVVERGRERHPGSRWPLGFTICPVAANPTSIVITCGSMAHAGPRTTAIDGAGAATTSLRAPAVASSGRIRGLHLPMWSVRSIGQRTGASSGSRTSALVVGCWRSRDPRGHR